MEWHSSLDEDVFCLFDGFVQYKKAVTRLHKAKEDFHEENLALKEVRHCEGVIRESIINIMKDSMHELD